MLALPTAQRAVSDLARRRASLPTDTGCVAIVKCNNIRADGSRSIENLGLLVGQLAYGSGFGDRGSLRAYVAS